MIKSILLKSTFLGLLFLFLPALAAAATIYTNQGKFGVAYGTAGSTFLFTTLVDGSDESDALSAQQIMHPTLVGRFLIHSIKDNRYITLWGNAFSDDWTFHSAQSAGRNVKRLILWRDDGIEILDGSGYLQITAPDDDEYGLNIDDGSFVGVAPASGETIVYIADPGNVQSIAYNYDGVPVSDVTWQGGPVTWQGGMVEW